MELADQNLHGLDVEPFMANDHAARFDLASCYHRRHNASLTLDPDTPADSLSLLTDSKRRRIASWRHERTLDIPDLCVQQMFEQPLTRTVDAIDLIFQDQQLYLEQTQHLRQPVGSSHTVLALRPSCP